MGRVVVRREEEEKSWAARAFQSSKLRGGVQGLGWSSEATSSARVGRCSGQTGQHDLPNAQASPAPNHRRRDEHEWPTLVELLPGQSPSCPSLWLARGRPWWQMRGTLAEVSQLGAAGTETSSAGQNMMTTQVPSPADLARAAALPALTARARWQLLIAACALLPVSRVSKALRLPIFGAPARARCARSEGSSCEPGAASTV